jgi:adenylylsulfate kinase
VESPNKNAFAVWVTGLPASGKSAVSAALKAKLKARGVDAAVLESDDLRRIFTPHPRYDEEEREVFYGQMAYVGALLTKHGVPVIFDATANRRRYRDQARREIGRFIEVHVDTPLDICIARDPKGIYRQARESSADMVPGLRTVYEPPDTPDVVIHGDQDIPEEAARRIIAKLLEKAYL